MYQLKRVWGENLFGYGKLDVSFDEEDICLIYGKNGSGKSALLDIISWILYNDFPRKGLVLADLIKEGETEGLGSIEFSDGSVIKRTRNRKGETNLEINGFEEIGEDRRPARIQEVINSKFGNYQIFMRSHYMTAGFLSLADASLTPGKRMDVIRMLLGINTIQKALEQSKSRIKNLDNNIREMSTILTPLQATKKEIKILTGTEIKEHEKNLKIFKKNIEIADELKETEKKLNELKNKKLDFEKELNSFVGEEFFIKKIDRAKAEFLQKKAVFESKMEELTKEKKELEQKLENDALSKVQSKIKEISSLVEKQKHVISELLDKDKSNIVEERIHILNMDLKVYQDRKIKPLSCPICQAHLSLTDNTLITFDTKGETDRKEKSIAEILKKIEQAKKELNSYIELREQIAKEEQKLFELEKKQTPITIEEAQLKEAAIRLSTILKLGKSKYNDHQLDEQNHEKEIQIIEQDKEFKLKKEQERKVELISLIKQVDNDITNFKTLSDFDKEVIEKYYEYVQKITAIEIALTTNEDNKKLLIPLNNQIQETQTKIDEMEKELKLAVFAKETFPKVEKLLFSRYIPFLEQKTNSFLSELSDLRISLEVVKTGIEIFIIKNGIARKFEQHGRGERARVAICTTFASREIRRNLNNTSLGFIAVDEALDFLDVDGIQTFLSLLLNISGNRIIVSHNEDIQSIVPFTKILNVANNERGSYLKEVIN